MLDEVKSQVFKIIILPIQNLDKMTLLTLSVTAAALIIKSLTDTLISSEKDKEETVLDGERERRIVRANTTPAPRTRSSPAD